MEEELVEDDPTEEVEEDVEAIEFPFPLLGGEESWAPGLFAYFGKQTRSVLITGELTDELCMSIVSQLLSLGSDEERSEEPIFVHINTYGGSTIGALAIHDVMRALDSHVVAVVSGACFSAGLIILSAADERIATQNSVLLYHEPIVTPGDGLNTQVSITSLKYFYNWNLKRIEKIIRKRAGISKRLWRTEFRGHTAKYIDVNKALSYNLIDSIIPFSEKKRK